MPFCPTCGQSVPQIAAITNVNELVRRMRENRECYEGADHWYYLTREGGGGPVPRGVIDDALAQGLIVRKWPDAPPEVQWWVLAP